MGRAQISRLIEASAEEAFAFIVDPANMAGVFPPEVEAEIVCAPDRLLPGMELEVRFARFGLSSNLVVRIEEIEPSWRFVYRQISGPLRAWEHVQLVEPHDRASARLTDVVSFRLPFGILGSLFDDLVARRDVERLLRARQERIALALAGARPKAEPEPEPKASVAGP